MSNIHEYAKRIYLDKDVINISKLESILKNNSERYFEALDCKLNEATITVRDNSCFIERNNKRELLNAHCGCAENLLSLITEDELFSVLNGNYVFIILNVIYCDGCEAFDTIQYITQDINKALKAIDEYDYDSRMYIAQMDAYAALYV